MPSGKNVHGAVLWGKTYPTIPWKGTRPDSHLLPQPKAEAWGDNVPGSENYKCKGPEVRTNLAEREWENNEVRDEDRTTQWERLSS